METKFNFNSQICTTREQSERLLALGLKKETADCRWTGVVKDSRGKDIPKNEQMWFLQLSESENYQTCGFSRTEFLLAWSLDRLIELIPENIITGVRNQWHRVMYNSVLTYEEGDDSLVSFRGGSIYDRFISCIYWLIKEGYFPKEYLEE